MVSSNQKPILREMQVGAVGPTSDHIPEHIMHIMLSLTSMEEQWSGLTNWNHVLVSCELVYPT